MPRHYNNAPAMSNFCLQCLPPLMRKLAEEERAIQVSLSRDTMNRVPFLCDDLKRHPRDFCLWAYQIAYTRGVEVATADGGVDVRLVPLADYFDHGSDATEIAPHYDDRGNYCAYTTCDVTSGTSWPSGRGAGRSWAWRRTRRRCSSSSRRWPRTRGSTCRTAC